jgi:hypothetical protein
MIMAKQLFHTRRIPVRGGVPMKGPHSRWLRDAKGTVFLSKPDLGKRLTLAGGLGDALGKRIQVLQNKKLGGRPVRRMPVSAGRMLPGLSGSDGFMPGLGSEGGFMPGLGGGEVRDRLGRAIRHTKRHVLIGPASKPINGHGGKMLPGLSDDTTVDTQVAGYLSSADLYDQLDGLGCCGNGWSGMPTPAMSAPGMGMDLPVIGEVTLPKMIAGAALVAFFMMSRRRYA